MNWIRNLSLKYKLTILLVLLTGTMLSIYGYLALRDFEKDKLAYVLDANRAHSRAATLQIRTEIGFIAERVKNVMNEFSLSTQSFNDRALDLFNKADQFETYTVWKYDATKNAYQQLAGLNAAQLDAAAAEQLIPQVLENEIAMTALKNSEKWLFGILIQVPGDRPLVVVTIPKSTQFLALFQVPQMYDTYLVDNSTARVILSPATSTYPVAAETAVQIFKHTLESIKAPEGAFEFRDEQRSDWMISKASVGMGKLSLLSIVPKHAALEAVRLLVIKSVLFLFFLIFTTIFISIISSLYLTKSLKELLGATKDIAKGNFNIKVSIKGNDEVGVLAKGFHKMNEEIQRLMIETAEKARMEGELKTAQVVQSTLFPKQDLIEKDFEIRGFNQSASECSGDWWYYQKIKNKTIFCIGDATGHGVPAALLTASARSSVSILETFPDITMPEMMMIFNRAIYNTANAQITMTFFLGSYDHTSGILSYINASHEPPILFPKKETITREDFIFLDAEINPSLGRDPNSLFKVATVPLNSGDRLMLYTDGMTELQDSSGKTWGERALLKCLIRCANEQMNLEAMVKEVSDEFTNFRKETGLVDDVTYFFVGR